MERHILETPGKTRRPMNIPQITRAVKEERDTADKRIVARKLMAMESSGMVQRAGSYNGARSYVVGNRPV